MKIWIFNILVAGALAYLFLGESEQSRVKSDLDWAKDKVEATIDETRGDKAAAEAKARQDRAVMAAKAKLLAPVSTPITHEAKLDKKSLTQKPVSAVTVEPLEAPQPALVAETSSSDKKPARGAAASTGGARPREDIAEDLPPLDDPEVARRRAIVLDTGDADGTEEMLAESDSPVEMMTARERRDALNALAEDMELVYADKASR